MSDASVAKAIEVVHAGCERSAAIARADPDLSKTRVAKSIQDSVYGLNRDDTGNFQKGIKLILEDCSLRQNSVTQGADHLLLKLVRVAK